MVELHFCSDLTKIFHMKALNSSIRMIQRARITIKTCNITPGLSGWVELQNLTFIHCTFVIQAHGTTYLSVLPPSSKANLELTDAKEAQVPATTASIKPDADIL